MALGGPAGAGGSRPPKRPGGDSAVPGQLPREHAAHVRIGSALIEGVGKNARLSFASHDLAEALKMVLQGCDRIEAAGSEPSVANVDITLGGRKYRLSVTPAMASVGGKQEIYRSLVNALGELFGKFSIYRSNLCTCRIDWEIAEKELGASMTKARENRILAQMDTDKTVLSETAEKIAPAKLTDQPVVSLFPAPPASKPKVYDGPKPVRPDNRVITPLVLALEKWVQTQFKHIFERVARNPKFTKVEARESKLSSGEDVIIINVQGSHSMELGESTFSYGLSLYKSRAVFVVYSGFDKAIEMQKALEEIWGKRTNHPDKFLDDEIVTYYEFKLEDFLSSIKIAVS